MEKNKKLYELKQQLTHPTVVSIKMDVSREELNEISKHMKSDLHLIGMSADEAGNTLMSYSYKNKTIIELNVKTNNE